jgi:hypothetical protein
MAVIVAALWSGPFSRVRSAFAGFFQQKFEPQASTEPMGGCKSLSSWIEPQHDAGWVILPLTRWVVR